MILWGKNDKVLPAPALESLRDARGGECVTLPGNRAWLLADPHQIAEVMTNVVAVAAELGDQALAAELGDEGLAAELEEELAPDASEERAERIA